MVLWGFVDQLYTLDSSAGFVGDVQYTIYKLMEKEREGGNAF